MTPDAADPTPEEIVEKLTANWAGLVTGPGKAGDRSRESALIRIDERVVTDVRRAIVAALRAYGDLRAAEERAVWQAKHGGGKCILVGPTVTRPVFPISEDD